MTDKNLYPCLIEDLPPYYRNFLRSLIDARMTLYASHVFQILQLETERQFAEALDRAIQTMHKAQIPVENHIKPVYAGFGRQLIVDYKMTPLAFGLIAMQIYPDTEVTARLKTHWATKAFE